MHWPDRIGPLIDKLEAGGAVTQADADRTAALLALDVLKSGADHAREVIERENAHTEYLRQSLTEAQRLTEAPA